MSAMKMNWWMDVYVGMTTEKMYVHEQVTWPDAISAVALKTVRLAKCLFFLSQPKFAFIAQYHIQSQSYFKCQEDIRTALPKPLLPINANSLSFSIQFRGTGSSSDRESYGHPTTLDVRVGNIRYSLVQSPQKIRNTWGTYRKSWATIFCKVTCFIIDKPNTPT